MDDQEEVCSLSRRAMHSPYPNHYSLAFARSSILYPHRHRARFAACIPSQERYALTMFRVCDRGGLGPS